MGKATALVICQPVGQQKGLVGSQLQCFWNSQKTDAMFRPINGEAGGFGFVEYVYTMFNLANKNYLGFFKDCC